MDDVADAQDGLYYLYTSDYDIVRVEMPAGSQPIAIDNLAPMHQQPGLTLTTPDKSHPCRASAPPIGRCNGQAHNGQGRTPLALSFKI